MCAVAVVTACAVGCFGFGLASADRSSASADDFGLAELSSATSAVGQLDFAQDEASGAPSGSEAADFDLDIEAHEASVQASSMGFDVTAAATRVEARQERERIAKEEADRAAEVACREKALERRAEWLAASDHAEGVDTVDWSMSKAEFVEEWGARIDTFLSGSNLEGYGTVFAENAWDNSIDPRFSPAISFMESGRASNCFLSHNAWGWGSTGWDSWEEAIAAHVKGLADGYGYSLTYSGAQKYCPPNYAVWYPTVLAQIASM